MERYLIRLVFVLFLHFSLAVAHAQISSLSWTKAEMNPLPPEAGENDKKIQDISCGSGCQFDLHYFRGKNVPGGKSILFIAGGPGQIMKRVLEPGKTRFLDFLEDKYNVFYFDIRGAGFSAIERPNKFDTALRAAHVVEDIERIRIKELGANGTWDAVYGHSHGTIVAQLYANSSPIGSPRLNKLILSAPLSRLKDFEEARIDMLVKNFESILKNYRQHPAGENCPAGTPPDEPLSAEGTDNFCFLTTGNNGMVQTLVSKFRGKLTGLSETFGSVGFVAEFFDRIKELEPKLVTFPSKFPYPIGFYNALKGLSFFGGTESQPLEAVDFVRQARVNSAFLLAYYLALDEETDFAPGARLNPRECKTDAPFFEGVTNHDQHDGWKQAFCDRYLKALTALRQMDEAVPDSKRANTVYGLNDGINRFIFAILNVSPTQRCIDSSRVKNFANDTDADTHKAARAVARRIGIDLTKPICLWNPEEHAHSIPTLILKGGADPLISGCQAEKVFTNALTGGRVLFDFPGVGHLLQLPNFEANGVTTDGKGALFTLVDTFLKKSFADFSTDSSVKVLKDHFSATMRTATGPGGADICSH
jgi:pimeloyl-ACP methyl ester carboxylesterase